MRRVAAAAGGNSKAKRVMEHKDRIQKLSNAKTKAEEANALLRRTKDSTKADRDEQLEKAIKLYSEAISELQNTSNNDREYPEYFGKRAEAYMRLGMLREAKLDLLSAIRQDSKNPQFYCLLAKCHEESEQYTEALGYYEDAITHSSLNNPEQASIYLQRGILYEKQGKYKEGAKDFKRVLGFKNERSNITEQALLERGKCLSKIGKFQKALVCLKDALNRMKTSAPPAKHALALNELGLTYFQLGKFEDALENYTRAIDLDPENSSYYNNKALANVHLDYIDLAMNDFDKAIELQPDDFRSYLNRGDAHAAMKRFEKAHSDFDKALPLCADHKHLVLHSKGLCYQLENQLENAMNCFQMALEYKPDDSSSMFHLGLMQTKLNFLPMALETFTSVINLVQFEEGTDKRLAYEARGLVYLDMKNYEQAKQDFLEALRYDSECGEVYYYKGLAELELEELRESIDDFLMSLEKNSRNPGIYKGLGMAYKQLGEYPKSLFYLNAALERAPDNTQFLLQRAFLFIELKDYKKALEDLTKALEYGSDDPLIWYKRGLTLYLDRKFEEALDDLLSAAKRKPFPTYEPDIYYLIGLSLAHLERFNEAIEPFTKAINLCKLEAIYYHERAKCFHLIGEYEQAIEDYSTVIDLEPTNSYAYFGRGFAYKNIGCLDEAADDLERCKEISPKNPKLIVNYSRIHNIPYIRLCEPGAKE